MPVGDRCYRDNAEALGLGKKESGSGERKQRLAVGEDVPVCSATCGGGLLHPAGTVLLSAGSPSNATREGAAQSHANMPK